MQRFNLRRLSRRLSTSLAFLLLFAIFTAVVSEFFIELGKELGWYDKPSERLGAFVSSFSSLVTQTWALIATGFVTGMAVGLWTDNALRTREGSIANDPEITLAGEPGHLDYVVEGLESIQDIQRIFTGATRDVSRIARVMARYSMVIRSVNNFKWKRKLASRVATKLVKFSNKLGGYAPLIDNASKRTRTNCLAVIEGTPIVDHAVLNELVAFAGVLSGMAESSARTAAAMEESIHATQFVAGISREMNAAIELYSKTHASLAEKTYAYSNVCKELLSAAEARAARVSGMLAGQQA